MRQTFVARHSTALALCLVAGNCLAAPDLRAVVDASVKPLMQQQSIPGLVVGVVKDGKTAYFSYGVASKDTRQPVSENTLFEIGSVSKTFTATLAGYAVGNRQPDPHRPGQPVSASLARQPVRAYQRAQPGTYSAGGLPLQFPVRPITASA